MMSFMQSLVAGEHQIQLATWLRTFFVSTWFVAEVTCFPVLLSCLIVSWWVLNRNTRIRKTKGSSIPHKVDYGDDNDDGDGDDDNANANDNEVDDGKIYKPKQRQKLQALLKSFDVECDDDDDETILSADSYLEDPDYEDDVICSISNTPDNDVTTAKIFLSKKEIPIFSFFNEEAMDMCLNDIEYINLTKTNDFLWNKDFDGSLYYVVKGRLRVNFLDFKTPSMHQRSLGKEKEVASVIHEEDTVVTSLLAVIEGMIHYRLAGTYNLDHSLSHFKTTTAQAVGDGTRLLRIRPACFSRILDRFPETMLRIIQTTLNRTQRVTLQTLVRCCGLRQELLVPMDEQLKASMMQIRSSLWNPLEIDLAKININSTTSSVDLNNILDHGTKSLKKNACAAFASIIGIEESVTIEVLEKKCSLIAISSKCDKSGGILLEAGANIDSCYFLLKGAMEMGMYLPLDGISSKQLEKDASAWTFQRIGAAAPGSIIGVSALFTTDINLFEFRCVPTIESCDDPSILLKIPKNLYVNLMVKNSRAIATSLLPVISILGNVVHFLTWTTEWMHVEAAKEIVQKGSPCNSLYIVLNGRFRTSNRSKTCNRVLGEVVPPEEFGRGM